MANIRIRDLANTANTSASDDFMALDGLTNGTRKMSAFNPEFGGSIKVGDGATATPSIAFTSASTTGFFRLSATQIGCSFSGALAGYIWAPSANTIRFAGNSQGYFEAASAGALSIVAAGSNQNITLTPSGSGDVRIVGSAFSTLRFYDGATQKGALFFSTVDGALEYNDVANTSVKLYTGAPADSLVLSSSGFLLLGVSNPGNANGRIQLATHTSITGGIGFGTDVQLFRSPSSQLRFSKGASYGIFEVQGASGSYVDFYATNGTTRNGSVGTEQAGTMFVGTRVSADTVVMTNGTAALTINSSQNSVFAGNIAAQGSVASDGVNGNALFGGAKRVIIGYDTTADVGNIAAVHTGTAWKALALQPVSGAVLIGKTSDTGNGRLQFAESTSSQNGIQFGTDTNLYRSAANTLTTGGILRVGGASTGLYLAENTGGNAYVTSGVGTAATGFLLGTSSAIPLRFQINSSVVGRFATSGNLLIGTEVDSSNGRIQLADHTANTGGIGFGADVDLYRSAANTLRTNDSFQAEAVSGTNGASGILGVLNTSGAGVTNSFGVDARILVNNSSGTTTSAIGLRSLARVSNASTVSGLYSMYAQVDNPGGGTIAEAYGLYVGPITVGTTKYSIWTEGSSPSRFGGKVTFSDVTASTTIATGAAQIDGGLGVAGAVNVGTYYGLVDGVTAPATTAGYAKIYVDTADGDLKIKFGDGTIKTIVTDT